MSFSSVFNGFWWTLAEFLMNFGIYVNTYWHCNSMFGWSHRSSSAYRKIPKICTFGFGFGIWPKARCFSGQIFGFGLKWKTDFRSFTAKIVQLRLQIMFDSIVYSNEWKKDFSNNHRTFSNFKIACLPQIISWLEKKNDGRHLPQLTSTKVKSISNWKFIFSNHAAISKSVELLILMRLSIGLLPNIYKQGYGNSWLSFYFNF